MEGMLFKIAGFAIMLNLAAGLLLYIGQGEWSGAGLSYDSKYTSACEAELEGAISSSPVESLANFGEKILDFFTLGIYTKAKCLLNQTVYGFTTALARTGLLDYGLKTIIDTALSIVYIVGIFELFSNKRILG